MKHTDNRKGLSANYNRHLKLKTKYVSMTAKMIREVARLANSNSCNCSQRHLHVMHLSSIHKKVFKAVGLQLFFDNLFIIFNMLMIKRALIGTISNIKRKHGCYYQELRMLGVHSNIKNPGLI